METTNIEQIILYDVEQILKLIRVRHTYAATSYAKHLLLLLLVLAIKEEREYQGFPIIKHPDN